MLIIASRMRQALSPAGTKTFKMSVPKVGVEPTNNGTIAAYPFGGLSSAACYPHEPQGINISKMKFIHTLPPVAESNRLMSIGISQTSLPIRLADYTGVSAILTNRRT